MSANDYNGDMAASRKLTDEEASELRGILVKDLKYSPDEQEDVDDLLDYTFAMVSNGKSLSYVVQELVSMEMDVCKEPQAHGIAIQIAKFLEENVNQVQAPVQDDDDKEQEHRVVTLKSSESEGNALTMSGALGASRERGKKDEGRRQQSGGDRRDNNRQRGSGRQGNDRHGRGRGRMNASEAFERLSGNRNDRRGGGGGRRDDRKSDQGRSGRGGGRGDMRRGGRDMGRGGRGDMGRGGRGDMSRGGRGDMGRGGRGDMGRGGGRGSPNQRGGRGGGRNAAPMSGTRRSRDETRGEEDFIPAGRGGRVVGRIGGRVDGRDGGRGGRYEEGNKRQRTDDWGHQAGYSDNYYDESWGGYDEGNNDYTWRGGGYRGGRGGRGRGSGRGGRGGRGDDSQGDGEGAEGDTDAVSQAVASHPSPIVAASFGRGYRGRGRGRGRGGRFGYRAQVASMIASKSWVRPKAEDEGGNKGGSDSKQNGDGAADASEG